MLQNTDTNQSRSDQLRPDWVAALFHKMRAIFGNRFKTTIGEVEQTAIVEWSIGLAGLTGEQIRAGIDAMQALDWPPSLGEFRRLCLQCDDIPSAEEAWQIICDTRNYRQTLEQRWKYPIVLASARDQALDLYALRKLPAKIALKTFAPIYGRYVSRFYDGEAFVFPSQTEIEDKTGQSITPEEKHRRREFSRSQCKMLKSLIRGSEYV